MGGIGLSNPVLSLQDEYNLLLEEVDVRSKRSMAHAQEKGSRS